MILRILILIVALTASGCNYLYSKDSKDKFDRQDIWLVEKNDERNCRLDAEELRAAFKFEGINIGTYKPEEDPDLILIERLKGCPFEATANMLTALRNGDPNDLGTKAKATYLLVKIGYKIPENAASLLELYSERRKEAANRYKEKDFAEKQEKKLYDDRYGAEELLSLIADVLAEDYREKEYLSKVLELETEGALSERLAGICASEFRKSPEDFLRIVKPKRGKMRDDILFLTAYAVPNDEITDRLASIPKSSDVYSLTKELTKASNKIAGK